MHRLLLLACVLLVTGCHGGPCSGSKPSSRGEGSPTEPGSPCLAGQTQGENNSCRPLSPPAQKVVIEVVQKSAAAPPPAATVASPATVAQPQGPVAGYSAASYAAAGVPGTVQFATAAPMASPMAAPIYAPAQQRTGLGFVFDVFRLPIPIIRPAIVSEAQTVSVPVQPVSYAPAYGVAAPIAAAPPVAAAPQQYVDVPLVGTGRVPVTQASVAPAVAPPLTAACPPCPAPAAPSRAEIEELTRTVRELAGQVRQKQSPRAAPQEE